jgi:hypothetical protein
MYGFQNCIGAIYGTHVLARVPIYMQQSFRGRKKEPTQNVMVALDFDFKFTYVLAGWEGSAHDAIILAYAIERERWCVPPTVTGKFGNGSVRCGSGRHLPLPLVQVRIHANARFPPSQPSPRTAPRGVAAAGTPFVQAWTLVGARLPLSRVSLETAP